MVLVMSTFLSRIGHDQNHRLTAPIDAVIVNGAMDGWFQTMEIQFMSKNRKQPKRVLLRSWLCELCAVLRSADDNELMGHRLGEVAWAAAILCNDLMASEAAYDEKVRTIDLPDRDHVLDPAWCRQAAKVLNSLEPEPTEPPYALYSLLNFMARELKADINNQEVAA
jgi:hypothetical protein